MANKKRFSPFIVLGGIPGGSGDDGGGSVHGGIEPPEGGFGGLSIGPVSYTDWAAMNPYGSVTFEDYGQWWAEQGFGMDAWAEFNGGTPFTWYPDTDM